MIHMFKFMEIFTLGVVFCIVGWKLTMAIPSAQSFDFWVENLCYV